MPKRELTGKIVSAKMQKTVVVSVETLKEHSKYLKRIKSHKNYKAHNEKMDLKEGDAVVIRECAPISKDKKWEVIVKI
ncbi:MAG: 30S ribosomal protein S17 [Candidatus Pacebacteria bacterium]|nr:30S ribosomal protein S17 [Candidatus Paceibacterota bacterium]MDD3919083.1 30S ribosomal protein S17 [Candidatus Paceibacterota bacterium]